MTARRRWATPLVVALLAAVCVTSLVTGTYRIGPSGVLHVLAGGGSGMDRQIVAGQRLPRLLAALVVGAALSVSGAIFQTLSRNPLGSPDVLGFTTGCATGALVAGLATGTAARGGLGMGAGAVAGGFTTVAVTLAVRRGHPVIDDAMILTGIALAALLAAVNDFLLTRADLDRAEQARTWLYGSLNALGWHAVAGPGLVAVVLLLACLPAQQVLGVLDLGDERAASLGVHVPRASAVLSLLALALAGCAVAIAGPVSFVALAAPQLAHRLWGSGGLVLVHSLLMGALMLATADFVAARALAPFQLPVGLVTGAVGGAYLARLLASRRH